MPKCAFLTIKDLSDFECYDDQLISPMNQNGWECEFVAWDDSNVDWNNFDLVIIRSTWDYQGRIKEFLEVLENINSSNFEKLIECLNLISELYNLPIIVSTHPRTNNKINEFKLKLDRRIKLLKPLGYHDYNFLQINAKVVLSDSGTISEESSIMNFPALNIRDAHERPEAMEESSVMMVGLNKDRIIQGIELLNKQKRNSERTLFKVKDYSFSNVSEKIIRIIISYIDYVNRNVWKKTGF